MCGFINETMTGKQYIISGMLMEVVADEGEQWKLRNHTTKETILMDKDVLERSIKLGKAEEVPAGNQT